MPWLSQPPKHWPLVTPLTTYPTPAPERTHRIARNDHPICALDAQHTRARDVRHLGAGQGGTLYRYGRARPARSLGQPQATHGEHGAATANGAGEKGEGRSQ